MDAEALADLVAGLAGPALLIQLLARLDAVKNDPETAEAAALGVSSRCALIRAGSSGSTLRSRGPSTRGSPGMGKKTTTPPAAEPADDMVPARFVYTGLRRGRNGKMCISLCVIEESGTKLGEERWFPNDKGWARSVTGGIYKGASFSATQAMNVPRSEYVTQWPDKAMREEWQATEQQAIAADRTAKDEAKVGRTTDIERDLHSLRKAYESMGARGDWAGQASLEMAVMRALRKPLRSFEE